MPKPIAFVVAGSSANSSKDKNVFAVPLNISEKINGEEASSFYQNVIAMPSQQLHSCLPTKLRPILPGSTKMKLHSVVNIWKACETGKVDDVRLWLEQGGDVNLTDEHEWTLLMCAAYAGKVCTVKYLIDYGALPLLMNKRRQTAFHLAKLARHHEVMEVLTLVGRNKECNNKKDSGDSLEACSNMFCAVCNQNVSSSKHEYSTVHNFNCQHSVEDRQPFVLSGSNRGYQLMLRNGWDNSKGLGINGTGRKQPIATILKKNRAGIGSTDEPKARVTHVDEEIKLRTRINWPISMKNKTYMERKHRRDRAIEMKFRRDFNTS